MVSASHGADDAFRPVPFQIVDSPDQLKAFTDPLRARVLSLLAQHEATNQQVARALGEPQARVLHHVRALLEMGLIRLVDTRIKGGNVEKYYRAVAQSFGLRAPADAALRQGLANARFEALHQEVAASAARFPEQQLIWETRLAHLSPERTQEFYGRLLNLIAEYWGGPPDRPPAADPDAPPLRFATVIYRDPTDPALDELEPPPPRSS